MNAIYQPKGKAAEYAEWACNFYVGCSNNCSYCFLKKGRGSKILGGCTPTLKKCFKDEFHALEIFDKELNANLQELQNKGLFFSFTTDPMLPETKYITINAAYIATNKDIPVKILTKRVDWLNDYLLMPEISEMIDEETGLQEWRKIWSFGFTLTGHNELEINASTNQERIEAIKKLHNAGFKTFASIEPIIDLKSSMDMIKQTIGYCDEYKIGLLSGDKTIKKDELQKFFNEVNLLSTTHNFNVYWKDSIKNKLK